jgi:hypothetical protein
MKTDTEDKQLSKVFDYHQQTKHGFYRSADVPGYLDWINQPNPFRRYHESHLISLPLDTGIESSTYEKIYYPDVNINQPFNPQTISCFFLNTLIWHINQ